MLYMQMTLACSSSKPKLVTVTEKHKQLLCIQVHYEVAAKSCAMECVQTNNYCSHTLRMSKNSQILK